MKRLFALLLVLLWAGKLVAQPVPVIFDTDMGNDIDDALALAMLHAFESRGDVKLLAVTLTKDNPYAAPYVDLVNTFYGRGDIPIGVVKNGPTPEKSNMIQVPAERKRPDGTYVYAHDLVDGRRAPDAVAVLRHTLAAQPDTSVVIIQVGFSTNLARLLASGPDASSPLSGRDLAARKVKRLVTMAGAFPTGDPEYNVHIDLASARRVFGEWPTPVVTSGFEIGQNLLYPGSSIEHDYAYVEEHPVADAYRNYMKMPYDRPTWDLTAVLYAIRPDAGYFDASNVGTISVADDGRTRFTPGSGRHRYLVLRPEQRARVVEALVQLASQPPCSPTGTR